MTNQVTNTCDSAVGGAPPEEAASLQVFPDSTERAPKLCRRLPSIVVEPSDADQVESGELRWPPDDVSDDVTQRHQQAAGRPMEGAEPPELVMGGV
ncbi:LBH domain-containing protein 2-like [Gambusia affinis]|uniref:LBH domain-containing protein n=1 Tax=Gambusia affinis TaxID=33528 RepID=A0A315VXG5_GAMAF|nr:LBH domain-containing protein 2-like [Gambusia affinis]PWA28304.1 hypothetical protein CCH79_00019014 [Gambusia affinis]